MASPTCSLLISGITDDGLPRWAPNTNYWGLSSTRYPDLIVDSNGNYQACYAVGESQAAPPTWMTGVGDFTNDGGSLVWRRVIPIDGNFYNPLAYPLAAVRLGASFLLTWTSTDATSASISGIGAVPPSGSMIVTPDASLFYFGAFDYDHNLIFNVPGGGYANVVSVGAASYELTVNGPDGPASSLAMFMLVSPPATSKIFCFAPVTMAQGSDFGGVGAGTAPVAPSLPPWTAGSAYTRGTSIVDSNGFGQVAINNGTAAAMPPAWVGKGLVTTETTGLQWRNIGQIYPSTLRQTGFGPLWNRPNSSVTHGFEDMVVPDCVNAIPAYVTNTAYSIGDVVSILFGSGYLSQSGITYLECFYAGTTGSTNPSSGSPYSMNMMKGELIPDSSFNPGGTPVWKVLGSLTMSLNWVGTTVAAPDAYANGVSASGPLDPVFDGAVQSYTFGHTVSTAADIAAFLASPISYDPTYNAANTAGIPPTGMPPICPTWVSLGLDTGYINDACADGFDANVGGVWAEFDFPYTLPPNGSITVKKVTVPPGSPQIFPFSSSYGPDFSLADGEDNTSVNLPAGTYSVTETPVPGYTTTVSQDPTSIELADGQNLTIIFTNTYIPPVPARVLPYLKIPTGQGQSVDELNGQSSISALTVECIDKSNELKYLATKVEVIGKNIYFKMGFPGMNLSDFVPLHVAQITDVGRSTDGWMRFSCRDNLSVLDRALWFCGGPQPVALPWLYGQRYLAGQYVQDSNGNIEQCVVGGTSSSTQPPIWPGTTAPVWEPNTSYTLGYYAIDNLNGNLQAVTTVPSGHTSTRPINTGVSGNGFPNPPWGNTVGSITLDNSGSNVNGPISWTLIAINTTLGITVTDNDITWQIVAKPNQGAFGGSQAFYVYSIFGQDTGTPTPPATYAWQSNQYPTLDSNPRYIQLNPIDAFLVALQNELGVGQSPLLPPIVTTDPNDPSNALVFAPNPAWQQYNPGDDSTLINPNPFLDIPRILAVRDNQCSGQRFEWNVKRPVTAKQWIENEIMHPLGLYMFIGADGRIGLNSMAPSPTPNIEVLDQNRIVGTPDEAKLPIVNVVTVRCDVDDEGAYSAARVYDAEMTFAQQTSLATYLQEFSHSVESNGLRLAYDSYGVAYLFSDRVFRRHGFGTPEYTIECYLSEIRMELGDYFLLSHPLMMDYKSSTGQLGIQNVLCEIMDKQPNYAQGRVTFKAWDTRFMNTTAPIYITPAADSVPNWTSASAAQQKKYMFVSYWPGRYSDGDEGNEIF